MRRLPRILLNMLTLLASLLILVLAVLWIRSYQAGGDYMEARLSQKSNAGLLSTEGLVRFSYAYYKTVDAEPSRRVSPTQFRMGGTWTYFIDDGKNKVGGAYHGLTVTHWFASLLLSPLPITSAWRHRPNKAESGCVRCGYDLRATPDRCPECGHVPTSLV